MWKTIAIAWIVLSVGTLSVNVGARSVNDIQLECCDSEYLANDNNNCVTFDGIDFAGIDVLYHPNDTVPLRIYCYKYEDNGSVRILFNNTFGAAEGFSCMEVSLNISRSTLGFLFLNESALNCSSIEGRQVTGQCDSSLTYLKFWGATIVVFANYIYIVPYFLVVIIYFLLPENRNRAYDKSVICYNVVMIVLNLVQIGMGRMLLCHVKIDPIVYTLAGLSLMFLTISSTCWLFVCCYDMTLVITRFRWSPAGDSNLRNESKKFRIYSISCWSTAILPTVIVAIMDLTPLLPMDSIFRPNFYMFDVEVNYTVVVYVASIPVATCLVNSMLFAYTSYKMCVIKKATSMAMENVASRNTSTKRYLLFLKLYLLMDSAYISGALGAAFPSLWVFKFFRMVQPILMLMAMVPRKIFVNIFKKKLRSFLRARKDNRSGVSVPTQTT